MGADTFMKGTLESLPKFSGNVMILWPSLCHRPYSISPRVYMNNVIHLHQIGLNFLDFFHRLGGKEILCEKRNFGDCEWIFERAVVEALYI